MPNPQHSYVKPNDKMFEWAKIANFLLRTSQKRVRREKKLTKFDMMMILARR